MAIFVNQISRLLGKYVTNWLKFAQVQNSWTWSTLSNFFFSCESSKWCQCSNSHFSLNKPLEKLSSLWPLNFNIWSCLKTLPCLRNFPKFGFIFRKKIAVSLFTFVSANRSKFELGKISKISKIQKQKNKTNWDKSKLRIWFFNL